VGEDTSLRAEEYRRHYPDSSVIVVYASDLIEKGNYSITTYYITESYAHCTNADKKQKLWVGGLQR